ncbi:AAA family ATPase [Actinosynnema sp. ALI-1.44]|uniref:AAA family ATPase n=1 Tax=Actinosynnema sp. ALI-1.44 TaxID=1933779 RepID=UPI001EDC3AF7|nr:MoxR family ATPase [Actinosynnema sp. ALI-1.44]
MSDAIIFQRQFEALCANVEDFIRGKSEVVRLALVCLLAEGHLLIEDVPGVAKTSLAKAISRSIAGAEVKRIQFTPDLLPSDVTGVQVYDQGRAKFEFRQGPVFTNILLADEINRASPKTQSALLEVMAERQVTVDGRPTPVPQPFLCIATQNPIEHHGTYALPEAQLDRFMMRIGIGYPDDLADEVSILEYGVTRRRAEELQSVMEVDDLRQMIRAVREQQVADSIREYIAVLARATRTHPDVELGVSPRGGMALVAAAQAYAMSAGRSFVTADDVKAVASPVLNHRLLLTPEARIQQRTPESILADVTGTAPVPVGR